MSSIHPGGNGGVCVKSEPIPEPELTGFARRVGELRASLQNNNPRQLAFNTGAEFQESAPGEGEFSLPVWGRSYTISFPGLVACATGSAAEAPIVMQALLAYYFYTADGIPLAGEWVSFHTLPEGKFYNQAFQGYSGKALALVFGNHHDALQQAVLVAGGKPVTVPDLPGDFAITFWPLPRLPLLMAYWLGDEEFPANAQFLFDRHAAHYLPSDVCAVVGGMLAQKIIKARPDA